MKVLLRLAAVIAMVLLLPLWFIWAPIGLILLGYDKMMDTISICADWIERQF